MYNLLIGAAAAILVALAFWKFMLAFAFLGVVFVLEKMYKMGKWWNERRTRLGSRNGNE